MSDKQKEDPAAKLARMKAVVRNDDVSAKPVPFFPKSKITTPEKPANSPQQGEEQAAVAAKAPRDRPDFKKMDEEAVARDPVAGKEKLDAKLKQMTYYLSDKARKEFRILCAINGHSMNAILQHTVADYIEQHRDKLPK